jgi:voltage-gated potassium channel
MAKEMQVRDIEKLEFLSVLTLILSVYVLCVLCIDTFFKLSPEITKILAYFDNIICVVFLIDFIFRYRRADNKLKFMKFGWIDLISSIPTLDFLRVGRALRLIRLFRILRAFRSTNSLIKHIFKNKVEGTFSMALIFAFLMIIFSSIAILQVETVANSNIKSAEDALWWSYTTITTVGYGDKYPVTSLGRIIAVILMTVGVGLFGTFTGYMATFLISTNKEDGK